MGVPSCYSPQMPTKARYVTSYICSKLNLSSLSLSYQFLSGANSLVFLPPDLCFFIFSILRNWIGFVIIWGFVQSSETVVGSNSVMMCDVGIDGVHNGLFVALGFGWWVWFFFLVTWIWLGFAIYVCVYIYLCSPCVKILMLPRFSNIRLYFLNCFYY